MKLPFLLLSIFYLVATVVNSRKSGGYKEAILSCNNYIDSMIQDVLEENGDYFDPHPINESLLTFHKKVVFIDFKGEAKLTEGYISGLRNLHRVSSCYLSFEQGRLKVSAELEIEKMFFNFTGSVKAININKAVSGKGVTSKVFLSTGISLDAGGKESILEDLNVDYISNMTLEVEGMRFLGWMEEPTKTNVALFFKALTEKLVEVQMKTLMMERMKEKPFSLEKFDLDIGDLEVTTTEGDVLIGELVHSKEDANSYIGSVLENRFQLEAEYSKLSFKDSISDDRIDNVYVSNATDNYLLLRDGHLDNLTKLKRMHDCSHPVLRSSNITFICYLGFPRLKFLYTAESHNGDTTSAFDIVALIDDTRLDVKITTTVKDNIPSMLDLKINNVGKITVKVAHIIADAPSMQAGRTFNKDVVKNHFSEKLREILLGKLKDVLGYSIYKTPIHFID
ncbi:uncharacterized protein [Parasteatoda tepidariorum]|uniref:uncharacterized protein isoform X2 n=1 Tax=Parasteatoda tepidariorum TaxID=114398 RepID=UPI001C7291CB|nr:uncharacterized protein LOC107452524 isoform X2 [Parasteatoda tepidariorum]